MSVFFIILNIHCQISDIIIIFSINANSRFINLNYIECLENIKSYNRLTMGEEVLKELLGKAFTPTHVRDDPIIFTGFAVKRPK